MLASREYGQFLFFVNQIEMIGKDCPKKKKILRTFPPDTRILIFLIFALFTFNQ